METGEALRKIGLTEGEVKVYTALLGCGPTSSGRIIKEAGISSSKVYPVLDRLIAMGLATHISRGKRKVFQTTSPEKILDLLEKRKREIEQREKEIRKLLPSLIKRQKTQMQSHEATLYEGYAGVKTYYNSLLRRLRKGDGRLVFGARSGYPIAKGAQYFFRSYHQRWARKHLRTRMIFNQDLKGSASTRFFEESPLTEVRYLSQVTLSSIGIQKDVVDILVWTKETALVFVIQSREVARTFREYFSVLWKTAKR